MSIYSAKSFPGAQLFFLQQPFWEPETFRCKDPSLYLFLTLALVCGAGCNGAELNVLIITD